MDPYKRLLLNAAIKRDTQLAAIHKEYERDCAKIEALRNELNPGPKPPQKKKRIIDIILEVCPKDRAFLSREIHGLVLAQVPWRKFTMGNLNSTLGAMQDRGLLRRVERRAGSATWAVPELKIKPTLYGAQYMTDVVAQLLEELGPMNSKELVATMRRRGYRANDNPRSMLTSLRNGIARRADLFRKDADGRWHLISKAEAGSVDKS